MNNKEILSVDIHEYTVLEAKHYLERLLANLDPNIKEIEVIHGSNSGNALQNMIRKDLKSKKIKQRVIGMNEGVTRLILG